LDCKKVNYYCKPCFDFSHKTDARKFHKFQLISPICSPEFSSSPIISLSFCPNHNDQLLKYFCKTCGNTTCADCIATGQHKDHNTVLLEEAAENIILIYEQIINYYNKLKDHIKTVYKEKSELCEEHNKKSVQIQKTLEDAFNIILMKLRIKKKEIIKQFDDLEFRLQFKKDEVQSELNKECGIVESIKNDKSHIKELEELMFKCEEITTSIKNQLLLIKSAKTESARKEILSNSSIKFPTSSLISGRVQEISSFNVKFIMPKIDLGDTLKFIEKIKLEPTNLENTFLKTVSFKQLSQKYMDFIASFKFPNTIKIFDLANKKQFEIKIDNYYNKNSKFQISHLNNTIFISGGEDLNANIQKDLISIEINKGLVVQLEPMRNARTCHGSIGIQEINGILVLGGINEFGESINSCEIYSIDQNKWIDGPSYKDKIANISLCCYKNMIYGFAIPYNFMTCLDIQNLESGWLNIPLVLSKEINEIYLNPIFINNNTDEQEIILLGGNNNWKIGLKKQNLTLLPEIKPNEIIQFGDISTPKYFDNFIFIHGNDEKIYAYDIKNKQWNISYPNK